MTDIDQFNRHLEQLESLDRGLNEIQDTLNKVLSVSEQSKKPDKEKSEIEKVLEKSFW